MVGPTHHSQRIQLTKSTSDHTPKHRSNSCNQEEIDALMDKIRAYNDLKHTPQYEKISETTLKALDEQEVDEVGVVGE